MNVDIAQWVKDARNSIKMTQEVLALELGFSTKASISAIETGKNKPSFDTLLKISNICSYPLPYQEVKEIVTGTDNESEEFFELLFYNCKDSFPLTTEYSQKMQKEKIAIPKFILKTAGVAPEDAICLCMPGNSMMSVIPNGTTLVVDTSSRYILDGEIYAILQGSLLRIRILQNMPSEKIKLSAYNEDEYKDEVIDAKELEVIGRVFSWIVINK